MAVKEEVTLPSQRTCIRCNFVSSQEVCKACVLLEGLNKGLPKLGIGKSSKAKKMLEEYNAQQTNYKESLQAVVKEFDDVQSGKELCISDSKNCKSGLCKRKTKLNKNSLINPIDYTNSSNAQECCSNCSGNCERTKVNADVYNPKVNTLLQKYAINETNIAKFNGEGTLCNSSNTDDKLNNTDDEELTYTEHIEQEDEACSASCGKLGSLHIGF